MNIIESLDFTSWHPKVTRKEQEKIITALETGHVIFLPKLGFDIKQAEKSFLTPDAASPKSKNLSFDRRTNKLRGSRLGEEDTQHIASMMKRYCDQSVTLVESLFPAYRPALEVARTSYRPVQISGRESSYRKDDTLLHVDAFPATPNHGKRILRVFSNVNPHGESRHWRIGEAFEQVAKRFLPHIRRPRKFEALFLNFFGITKQKRSPYDHFMLNIHNHMKADSSYQKAVNQNEHHFPPGSTWLVMTDKVSHAAMSGQYVLEQTFHLPVSGMADETRSPLRILEKLTDEKLA